MGHPSTSALVGEADIAIVARSFPRHLPYHNLEHCLGVAERCNDAARYYGLRDDQHRALVVAGLYHDAGHLGHPDDDQNIQAALNVWAARPHLDRALETEVARLIRATRYPHTGSDRLDEQIIVDADLLATVVEPGALRRLEAEAEAVGLTPDWAVSRLRTGWAKTVAARHL